MFLWKYTVYRGLIAIIVALCLSDGAPTEDAHKTPSTPMPTTMEDVNKMVEEQMHLSIPRIPPLPPGLVSKAADRDRDKLWPMNGFRFGAASGLNFVPRESFADEDRKRRRFEPANANGPSALRVQGAGEMERQQQQQLQQQQQPQPQQRPQPHLQQQSPPQQRPPPPQQQSPERMQNENGEIPTAEEVKVESKASVNRQGHHPSMSEISSADHAAGVAKDIAKEVQGELDKDKRDQYTNKQSKHGMDKIIDFKLIKYNKTTVRFH